MWLGGPRLILERIQYVQLIAGFWWALWGKAGSEEEKKRLGHEKWVSLSVIWLLDWVHSSVHRCERPSMSNGWYFRWPDALSLHKSHCHGLIYRQLLMWEDRYMAFDAALRLICHWVLRGPFALALLALELAVALLTTLIWGEFLVGRVEALYIALIMWT